MASSSDTYYFSGACFITTQFLLGLLYFMLFVYSIYKFSTIQMKHQNRERKSQMLAFFCFNAIFLSILASFMRIYYTILAIANHAQLVSDSIIGQAVDYSLLIIYNNSFYVPDTIFLLLFLILMNQLVIYDKYAHVDKAEAYNQNKLFAVQQYETPTKIKIFILSYIFIQVKISFFIEQVMIILFYNIGLIPNQIINCFDFIINIIQPIYFVYYSYYQSGYFQGCPFKSFKTEKDIISLRLVLIFYSTSRFLFALNSIDHILEEVNQSIRWIIQDNASFATYTNFGLLFILEVIFMILLIAYSMNKKILRIISLKFQVQLQKKLLQSQPDDEESREFSIQEYKAFQELKFEEIQIGVILKSTYKSIQLGTLSRCKLESAQNKDFVCRSIEIKRISQYLLEEIVSNVQDCSNLRNSNVQVIKGMAINQEQIMLVVQYCKDGNLADLIFSAKIPDDIAKAKLLRQVITGLLYLHKQKIYHCNLTPCNILINNGNVLVADFGLLALKKYQSLTTGYTIKSHYSSPEQLRERSATPKGSPESDVYAFGMITWESYHGQLAFQNLKIQELTKLICEEQKRPKIAEQTPEKIKMLIRSCWEDEIQKRPTLEQVMQSLQN